MSGRQVIARRHPSASASACRLTRESPFLHLLRADGVSSRPRHFVTRHSSPLSREPDWTLTRAGDRASRKQSEKTCGAFNPGCLVNQSVASEEQLLLTLKQAAQRLAISRRTLERLIASGDFPSPLKIGRSSRVPLSDLQIYFARLLQSRGGAA